MCDYHHLTIYQLKIVYQECESYSKILVVESLLKYSEQSGLGFFFTPTCLLACATTTHSLQQKNNCKRKYNSAKLKNVQVKKHCTIQYTTATAIASMLS